MAPRRGPHAGKAWREQCARVKARDGMQCQACGTTKDLTVDHLVPHKLDKAPRRDAELVTLCRSCNSRKGTKPLAIARLEYRDTQFYSSA